MFHLVQILSLIMLNVSYINAECTINTPCPTSCPNGYAPGTAHTMDGCTVYCTNEPVNEQCQEGGSGCVEFENRGGGSIDRVNIGE